MTRLIFAAFLLVSCASAQTLVIVEQYETFERSTETRANTPTTDMWLQQALSGVCERCGLFVWSQASFVRDGYRQIYAGPSYKLTSWLEAGVGGGLERAENGIARFGSFVSASKGKDSLFGVYENGASGRWFLAVYGHKTTKWLSLGFHAQDYEGIGPRAEVEIRGITLWASCLFESEAGKYGTNYFAGAKKSFSWPKR